MFNLWNLFFIDSSRCGFDVTRANMPRLKDGSIEWVRKCLEVFDLDCEVLSWQISPFRSQYFSDYLDSEEWEDRWQACWHFIVEVSGDLPEENSLQHGPKHVDMTDPSWEFGYQDPEHNERAILIFDQYGSAASIKDFTYELIEKSGANKNNVQMMIIPFINLRLVEQKREIEQLLSKDSSESDIFLAGFSGMERSNLIHQARITFNEIEFPEFADVMDTLLQDCHEKGMSIEWRTTVFS